MRICEMSKYKLLNIETIEKAIMGDSAAIQKVISHYTQYTRYFSKNYGVLSYDVADEIQTHLMQAILKFHIRKE